MAYKPFDRRTVEEVSVVLDEQLAGDNWVNRQAQLELRAAAVQEQRLPIERVQRDAVHRGIGDIKHDLGEWRTAGVAALPKRLHQPVERDVLMGEAFQGCCAHALQGLPERRIARQIDPQH